MMSIRHIIRAALPASTYDWLAARYQAWRRLFVYPAGADLRQSDYDAYWREKAMRSRAQLASWRLRRAHVFASLLSPGDRVLDLGVGDGAILHHLVTERQIVAQGLDISPDAVRFCREQGLRVDLADLARPFETLPDGSWDYAILSEVLEHLPNPEQLLEALRPRVRNALIVSVPNSGFITHRLRLLLGRFPLQWVVWPGEHLRFWTITDFAWWTLHLDFTIVGQHPYEGVRVLRRWWPTLFAAGLVYVLRDARPRPPAGCPVESTTGLVRRNGPETPDA